MSDLRKQVEEAAAFDALASVAISHPCIEQRAVACGAVEALRHLFGREDTTHSTPTDEAVMEAAERLVDPENYNVDGNGKPLDTFDVDTYRADIATLQAALARSEAVVEAAQLTRMEWNTQGRTSGRFSRCLNALFAALSALDTGKEG